MAPPRLTAVVTAFWPERTANVLQVIADLQGGTRPPDTLILLNNNPGLTFEPLPDVLVVQAWNTQTRGKFVAALFAQADYYLLNDDDITVGPETVERLLCVANPAVVTANRGVVLHTDSFYAGEIVDADKIAEPRHVDSVHGSSLLMGHSALLRMFEAEKALRDRWPTEGDDILAGLANRASTVIFPMTGAAAWRRLDDAGVGLDKGAGYFEMRDRFTRDALSSLGGEA